MKQYAILLGSAKTGFQQKKLIQLHDSLVSDGGFSECEIAVFPNGTSELLLEFALNNAIEQNNCVERHIKRIFLYICATSPVLDSDESIWLGGEEIRKSVIEHYASIFGDGFQVIYDSDRKEISEEELGYVKC